MIKKLLVPLLGLLLLGGGVVGGMIFLNVGPFKNPEKETKSVSEMLNLGSPAPAFMDMPPLVIPIFIEDRPVRNIYLEVRLDVDYKNRKLVEARLTKLRDAFLTDMHTFLPAHLRYRDSTDLEAVKLRLKRVADRTLGEGQIKNVLIRTAYDRNH